MVPFAERREEKILELTGRLAVLEQQLRQDAPHRFVGEMYPELGFISVENRSGTKNPVGCVTPEEMRETLHFLIQMIQLMEDVWLGLSGGALERPNNLGWMNIFQRWAYTPSFRLWWPILKPMHGRKFRRFMEERFNLADEDYPETGPRSETASGGSAATGCGAGLLEASLRLKRSEEEKPKEVYAFDLMLTHQREAGDSLSMFKLDWPLLMYRPSRLPPGMRGPFYSTVLWGAGLGALFLEKLLDKLKKEGFDCCKVAGGSRPR